MLNSFPHVGPGIGAALQGPQGVDHVSSFQSHDEAVGFRIHGFHAHGLELQAANEGLQVCGLLELKVIFRRRFLKGLQDSELQEE